MAGPKPRKIRPTKVDLPKNANPQLVDFVTRKTRAFEAIERRYELRLDSIMVRAEEAYMEEFRKLAERDSVTEDQAAKILERAEDAMLAVYREARELTAELVRDAFDFGVVEGSEVIDLPGGGDGDT